MAVYQWAFVVFLSVTTTYGQVIVNPDGTHSVVHGSVIVNPNGTHSVIHGSGSNAVIVNPDGTHSVKHGSVIVNPNGTHSTIHKTGANTIIVGPNGSRTVMMDSTKRRSWWPLFSTNGIDTIISAVRGKLDQVAELYVI